MALWFTKNKEKMFKINDWISRDSKVLDLGCGDGSLLNDLRKEKSASGLGIEIDAEKIKSCLKKGISVIEQDIDSGLENFSNQSFDYVVNLGGHVDHLNKRKTFQSHYIGCKNLTKIFLKKLPLSFIQVGSSMEYGNAKSPQKENFKCKYKNYQSKETVWDSEQKRHKRDKEHLEQRRIELSEREFEAEDYLDLKDKYEILKSIKKNHTSKLKILSSKVKKLSRQDRIEKIAGEKFNLHIPSPESLIVFMGEGYD